MADQDDDEILYNDPEGGTPPAEGDQDPAGSGDGGSNSHVGTPHFDATTTASSGGSTRAVTAAAPQPANPEKPLSADDAPEAPTYTAPDRTKLDSDEALYRTDAAPLDKKALAPKWYDRLLGGLAGGLSQNAQAGAGVTNRKYNAAAAQQQSRVTADQGNITQDRADMKDEDDLYQHRQMAFDAADRGFNTKAQAQQRTIENQRQTANDAAAGEERLYEHNRDTIGDQRKDAEDKHTWSNQDAEINLKRQEMGQTAGFERQRIGLEGQRLKDDEADSASKQPGSPASNLKRQQDANTLLQKRNAAINSIEHGNPEKGTDGFAAALAKVQSSGETPDGRAFKDAQEREQYVAQMKADHKAQLDDAENQYAQSLNTLGFNAVPVQHDMEGHALNDSSGRPLNGQPQAAPVQQAQAAPPAQPGGGQQPVDMNAAPAPAPLPLSRTPAAQPPQPPQQAQSAVPPVNPQTRKPWQPGETFSHGGKTLYVRKVDAQGPIFTTNPALVHK